MMDKLAYSPTETAEALGVSRPVVYALMKRADFPVFKVGSRTLVSVEGLRAWVPEDESAGLHCRHPLPAASQRVEKAAAVSVRLARSKITDVWDFDGLPPGGSGRRRPAQGTERGS